jgi:hypothetical protein
LESEFFYRIEIRTIKLLTQLYQNKLEKIFNLAIMLLFFGKFMSSIHFGFTKEHIRQCLPENKLLENINWNKEQKVFSEEDITNIFRASQTTSSDQASICPMETETPFLSAKKITGIFPAPQTTSANQAFLCPMKSKFGSEQVTIGIITRSMRNFDLSPEKHHSIGNRKLLEFSYPVPNSFAKKNKYNFLDLNQLIPEWEKIRLIDLIFCKIQASRAGLAHNEMARFVPCNLRIRSTSSSTMIVYAKKSACYLPVSLQPPKQPYSKRYKKSKADNFFIVGKICEQLFPLKMQVQSSFSTYSSLNSLILDLTNLDVNVSVDPQRIKNLFAAFNARNLNSIIHLSQLHQ